MQGFNAPNEQTAKSSMGATRQASRRRKKDVQKLKLQEKLGYWSGGSGSLRGEKRSTVGESRIRVHSNEKKSQKKTFGGRARQRWGGCHEGKKTKKKIKSAENRVSLRPF